MPNFTSKLAGSFAPAISDALLNYQFANPSSPEDLQKVGNVFQSLLGKGSLNFQDKTGRAGLNPFTGQFEAMGKNLGIGLNPMDRGVELKFQFGKNQAEFTPPMMMNQFLQGNQNIEVSPARAELEQQLNDYRNTNPSWYRYQ